MGQEKEKKERHARQSYSWEFKRQVIEEYLSTGANKASILRKHNIRFYGAFRLWMEQLGYEDIYKVNPYFRGLKANALKKQNLEPKSNEPEDEASLRKRIKQLERQLEDEKFRSEAYDRMINLAEKQFKISIRKKPNTK